MGLLQRSRSGLLGLDTFGRAAGSTLGNGWVVESGTWEITGGGTLRCTSADGAVRWDTIAADGMVCESTQRSASLTTPWFMGNKVMARPGDTSYETQLVKDTGGNPSQVRFYLRTSGTQVQYAGYSFASPLAASTDYTLRVEFQPDNIGGGAGNRRVQAWVDNVLVLGPNFNPGSGHTGGTDSPGLSCQTNAGTEWTRVLVTRRTDIVINGLSGTQGAQLLNPDSSVAASSGPQSGGTAYIPVPTFSWPFTGYIQLYDDQGTWLSPMAVLQGGRYPSSGTAADIYGGDVYEPPSAISALVQVNWSDTEDWPAFWTAPDDDISQYVEEIHTTRRAANPSLFVDSLELKLDNATGRFVPTRTDSPLYPNIASGRRLRVIVSQGGASAALFYGLITTMVTPMDGKPAYKATLGAESPLSRLANVKVPLPTVTTGYVYNTTDADTLGRSVLPQLLDLAGTVNGGFAIPAVNRDLVSSTDTVTDWGGETMSVAAALEDLACRVGALWWAQPLLRATSGAPDWLFKWVPSGWRVGEAASVVWDADLGDLDDARPTFGLQQDKR